MIHEGKKGEEITSQDVVACNGGESFGHPKVYLYLNSKGEAFCPYCNHHFRPTPHS